MLRKIWLQIFFPVCLLSFSNFSLSQSEKTNDKLALTFGVGNYEYLHIGLKLPINTISYVETAVGVNPVGISVEKYLMCYLTLGTPFLKNKCTGAIYPFFQLKAITWDLENNYNRFLMLGVGPEIGLHYKLNKKFALSSNGGIIYNSLLYYERKTDLEVGWPKEFAPSFSLQVAYWIK